MMLSKSRSIYHCNSFYTVSYSISAPICLLSGLSHRHGTTPTSTTGNKSKSIIKKKQPPKIPQHTPNTQPSTTPIPSTIQPSTTTAAAAAAGNNIMNQHDNSMDGKITDVSSMNNDTSIVSKPVTPTTKPLPASTVSSAPIPSDTTTNLSSTTTPSTASTEVSNNNQSSSSSSSNKITPGKLILAAIIAIITTQISMSDRTRATLFSVLPDKIQLQLNSILPYPLYSIDRSNKSIVGEVQRHINTAGSGGRDEPVVHPDSGVIHPTDPSDEEVHKRTHQHEHKVNTGDEHESHDKLIKNIRDDSDNNNNIIDHHNIHSVQPSDNLLNQSTDSDIFARQQYNKQQAAIKEQELLQSLLVQLQQLQHNEQQQLHMNKQRQPPPSNRSSSSSTPVHKPIPDTVQLPDIQFDNIEHAKLYLNVLQDTIKSCNINDKTDVNVVIGHIHHILDDKINSQLSDMDHDYHQQITREHSRLREQYESEKQQLIELEHQKIERQEQYKYQQQLQSTIHELKQQYTSVLKYSLLQQNNQLQHTASIQRGQRMIELSQLKGKINALKQIIQKQNSYNQWYSSLFQLHTIQQLFTKSYHTNNYTQLCSVIPLIQHDQYLSGIFRSIVPHLPFLMSTDELHLSFNKLHTNALELLYLPQNTSIDCANNLLINILAHISSKLTINSGYLFDQQQIAQKYDTNFMLLNRSYHAVQNNRYDLAIQYIEQIDNAQIQQLMHNWLYYARLKLQCDTVNELLQCRLHEISSILH